MTKRGTKARGWGLDGVGWGTHIQDTHSSHSSWGQFQAGRRARRKGKAKAKRGDNSGTTRGMVVGAHTVLCPTTTQPTGASHHPIPKLVPFLGNQFKDPLRYPWGGQ